MYQGNLQKRVSFRVSEYFYNSLYEKYKQDTLSCPNVSFSDYLRSLVLGTLTKNANKTENQHYML